MINPIGREVTPGHRVVSSSMLPGVITECPHCGSKNFTILGNFMRPFELSIEEGAPKEGGMVLGPQLTQVNEGLLCKACGLHTIIQDENIFEQESLIFDLHTQIAVLQGRVGTPPAKEWKN